MQRIFPLQLCRFAVGDVFDRVHDYGVARVHLRASRSSVSDGVRCWETDTAYEMAEFNREVLLVGAKTRELVRL